MFNPNEFISQEDRERERSNRDDRKNPPSVEHGQSDDFSNLDLDSLFGSNSNSTGGDPFGSGSNGFDSFGSSGGSDFGGGGGFGGGFNNGGFGGMQQQPTKPNTEDIVFDVAKKGSIGLYSFTKSLVDSFKGLDAIFWSRYGNILFKVSGVLTLFLFLMVILGVNVTSYMVGSGLTSAIGVLTLAFNNDKARQLREGELFQDKDSVGFGGFDINEGVNNFESFENESNSTFNDSLFDSEETEDEFEESDEDEFWDFDEEEDEFEDDEVNSFETVVEQESDVNEVLSQADDVPQGLHTRNFLYENYLNVLTKMTPAYSDVIFLTEDDEEWDTYSLLIREAQDQMNLDSNDEYEDDLSELLSVEKRLLTIKIEATRPKKLTNSKVSDFDHELTNLVSVVNGELVVGRYTRTIVSGSKIYTTIYLGETATVSVKDALIREKDFMLDTSNRIPVVLGFDHLGNTVKVDLFKVESIITAGEPRSGKSFLVKTAVSQIIQFCSPREANFYFGDVKGDMSDWKEIKSPHVKNFKSDPRGILDMLTYLDEIEGKRRAKLFNQEGVINIQSFKKARPDIGMPIIYVILDEMTSLADEFSTEDSKRYRAKLKTIATKLPAYGIRLWGIPHVIKNEVLPKTVSDIIGCRMSVGGDANHIEASTGAKPKQFNHKLTNKGDVAVKMPIIKPEVFFMHAFILAKDDEGIGRVFDYQTKLWTKLDPDSVKDSVYAKEKERQWQNKLLDDINLDKDLLLEDDGMF